MSPEYSIRSDEHPVKEFFQVLSGILIFPYYVILVEADKLALKLYNKRKQKA